VRLRAAAGALFPPKGEEKKSQVERERHVAQDISNGDSRCKAVWLSTGIAGVHPARTPPRSVLQSRNRLAETAIRLWNTNNVFVRRLDGLRVQFGL
jgi:hypothetical protein